MGLLLSVSGGVGGNSSEWDSEAEEQQIQYSRNS